MTLTLKDLVDEIESGEAALDRARDALFEISGWPCECEIGAETAKCQRCVAAQCLEKLPAPPKTYPYQAPVGPTKTWHARVMQDVEIITEEKMDR